MFDAGFTELLLLFIIALLILGPERLPKVAAQLGRWIGRARRTANELRRQLEREIELNEVTRPRPAPKPTAPAPPDPPKAELLEGAAELPVARTVAEEVATVSPAEDVPRS